MNDLNDLYHWCMIIGFLIIILGIIIAIALIKIAFFKSKETKRVEVLLEKLLNEGSKKEHKFLVNPNEKTVEENKQITDYFNSVYKESHI